MSVNLSINLSQKRKPQILDQFIQWAMITGRFIVIIIEVIALSAFIYRFGIDKQLIDYNDRIIQEQNIVNLLKKQESSYKNLQERLDLSKNIMFYQAQNIQIYNNIENLIPPDMDIQTFVFNFNNIRLVASSQSPKSISNFISNLKNYSEIKSVSIDNIQNQTSQTNINITLTIYLKNENIKNL